MEKTPPNKTLQVVGMVLMLMAILLIWFIVAVEGSNNSKPIPVAQEQQAVKDYYKKLMDLSTPATTAYQLTAKKAAAGDIKGTYQDFKGKTGQLVQYASFELFKLKSQVPEVSEKQLLDDATQNLWLSFSIRDEAIKAFDQGVEESKEGKFLEAKNSFKKADGYFEHAKDLLEQVSNKYGVK